jgi:hypothetical protein
MLAEQLPGRFRPQVVVFGRIADFYDRGSKTIIEVDGPYHNDPVQMANDSARDRHLKSLGLRTIRITNAEVLADPVAASLKVAGVMPSIWDTKGSSTELPALVNSSPDRRLARSMARATALGGASDE